MFEVVRLPTEYVIDSVPSSEDPSQWIVPNPAIVLPRREEVQLKGNGTNDEPSMGPAMETRVVAAITLKSPRPVMTLTRPKDLTAAQLAAEPRSNPSINDVTRSGRIYQPAQLRGPVAVAPEIPPPPPPARRAEVAESYDVAQHLKRIPADIRSITNLAAS